MADVVRIHGLDEIRRALKNLPKDIRKKELDKSLQQGALIVKRAAQQLAPVGAGEAYKRKLRGKDLDHKPGTLRKSIAIRTEKKRYLQHDAMKRVGVLHSNRDPNIGAWYWRFVEFGTRKMAARPFLTPAFEATKYAANNAIIARLKQGISDSVRRVKVK